ncbi:ArsA-related P-loop ATPase [Streptomyces sp. ODS05-4]|uniref:ArsA family ATPase n=1 Tax=Streptomyces sp. ODS05-4 TaxID=2944939 RepID=UPI00210C247F|nr:ArsA-related P-loop ATPase [Streptomyces sp. ODS05-4]
MRTLLVTGPGGSGHPAVAAATALRAARDGRRTLLLTPDRETAAALADAAVPGPGDGPAARPTVRLLDPAAHFRTEFLDLQRRCAPALDLFGAAPLAAEELTELPGAPAFALLAALAGLARAEDAPELLVVDLPPLPDAVALLALPAQLRRYLRRLLPAERQAARALRPVLGKLAGVPLPAAWLYETAARRDADLAAAEELLAAPDTSVRLVAEPGPDAVRALRTARTGLALHQLALDTAVAVKLLPTASPDPWLAALAAGQQAALKDVAGVLDGTPPHELAHPGAADDPATLPAPPPDPAPAAPAEEWTVEDHRAGDGVLVWRIPLPGAAKTDLGLVRRGGELVLTVGPFRRIVPLPAVLRRCTVAGAGLADGVLRLRFTPDPAAWPRER